MQIGLHHRLKIKQNQAVCTLTPAARETIENG